MSGGYLFTVVHPPVHQEGHRCVCLLGKSCKGGLRFGAPEERGQVGGPGSFQALEHGQQGGRTAPARHDARPVDVHINFLLENEVSFDGRSPDGSCAPLLPFAFFFLELQLSTST